MVEPTTRSERKTRGKAFKERTLQPESREISWGGGWTKLRRPLRGDVQGKIRRGHQVSPEGGPQNRKESRSQRKASKAGANRMDVNRRRFPQVRELGG